MYFLLTDSVSVAEIARVMMPAGAGSEMISRFELRRSAAGGYYFMLLTDSNAVIATSERPEGATEPLVFIPGLGGGGLSIRSRPARRG